MALCKDEDARLAAAAMEDANTKDRQLQDEAKRRQLQREERRLARSSSGYKRKLNRKRMARRSRRVNRRRKKR
ncbi:MAG TPA: hypothetical protein DCE42_05285 [Myxococcales bacterium]|nr:hypothetical protein [Deltaproteobacteria bacterium]MBK07339.1 hypothetical protein [Deltaproteobacteria bacterium]MBU53243.1 hypothetical protein [Deltaproteobacteria bacterium]HAA54145.1 hypothetical protein [Myxococcales bacterium]